MILGLTLLIFSSCCRTLCSLFLRSARHPPRGLLLKPVIRQGRADHQQFSPLRLDSERQQPPELSVQTVRGADTQIIIHVILPFPVYVLTQLCFPPLEIYLGNGWVADSQTHKPSEGQQWTEKEAFCVDTSMFCCMRGHFRGMSIM